MTVLRVEKDNPEANTLEQPKRDRTAGNCMDSALEHDLPSEAVKNVLKFYYFQDKS